MQGDARGGRARGTSRERARTDGRFHLHHQGVLRERDAATIAYIGQHGHYFVDADGAPCVDGEAVGAFARALVPYSNRLFPLDVIDVERRDKAHQRAWFCAAMVEAFADGLDDVRFLTMTETEKACQVTSAMAGSTIDLSHQARGKAVGMFLRTDIDFLEEDWMDGQYDANDWREAHYEAENTDEEVHIDEYTLGVDRIDRGGESRVEVSDAIVHDAELFRAKIRIFLMTHGVLGTKTLSHLLSEHAQGAGIESAFRFKTFTIGFMGLLSTRKHTNVSFLRTLISPNFQWFILRMAQFRGSDASEAETSITYVPEGMASLSLQAEMALYRASSVPELTTVAAFELTDNLNANLGSVFDPQEIFNENIIALSKLLSIILRETAPGEVSFARIVFGVTDRWDPTYKLMLLGALWEICPQTQYLLEAFFSRELRPAPPGAYELREARHRDLPASRVGAKFLAVFKQRHHLRLKANTCVAIFEIARQQWSESERERVTVAILRDCQIGLCMSVTECEFGCCRHGINSNILALMVYLGEAGYTKSKKRNAVKPPKSPRPVKIDEDARADESLFDIDFEYDTDTLVHRENGSNRTFAAHNWLAPEE